MAIKKGYDEEGRLDKAQDLRLLKRLLPFLTPYRRLLIGSILLVMVITTSGSWPFPISAKSPSTALFYPPQQPRSLTTRQRSFPTVFHF